MVRLELQGLKRKYTNINVENNTLMIHPGGFSGQRFILNALETWYQGNFWNTTHVQIKVLPFDLVGTIFVNGT